MIVVKILVKLDFDAGFFQGKERPKVSRSHFHVKCTIHAETEKSVRKLGKKSKRHIAQQQRAVLFDQVSLSLPLCVYLERMAIVGISRSFRLLYSRVCVFLLSIDKHHTRVPNAVHIDSISCFSV